MWRPVVCRALTPGAGGTGCGGRMWSSPYSSYKIPPGVALVFNTVAMAPSSPDWLTSLCQHQQCGSFEQTQLNLVLEVKTKS